MKQGWRHKKWAVLILSVLLLVAAGCQNGTKPQETGYNSPAKSDAISYPMTVKDQAGNTVTIRKEPQRIVSLIPSNTEIAYALHLDKQMVGDTTNDDYPEAAKKLAKVGDMKIDPEKVLALKPDLVLANTANGRETIDQLKKLGLTVLVTDAKSLRDVYKSIDLIATATNHKRDAGILIAQMEKVKQDILHKVSTVPKEKRVKVWVEIDPTLFTAGGDTFLNEMVTLAGGDNVAAGMKGWPQVSAEQVIKWNPDVIISTYGSTNQILTRKGWENVSAVKNKRVYAVDPNLVSRPGPRIIQGVEQMAKDMYPDKFGGSQ
jgi:iron complex transport system substrate-binding protein